MKSEACKGRAPLVFYFLGFYRFMALAEVPLLESFEGAHGWDLSNDDRERSLTTRLFEV
jgi:hypothetical protein